MPAPALLEVENQADPVEEIRLRTWARHNFVPAVERSEQWPLVVLDEMARIDREG